MSEIKREYSHKLLNFSKMFLSKEKARKLLDGYSRLTAPGRNMDTLEKLTEEEMVQFDVDENTPYRWMGRDDQGPTYLSEGEMLSLIPRTNWSVNLF